MSKSQLVDFAWQLKEEYNELLRRVEDLQMMKDNLEIMLVKMGESKQS
jgi:hypothetical protein